MRWPMRGSRRWLRSQRQAVIASRWCLLLDCVCRLRCRCDRRTPRIRCGFLGFGRSLQLSAAFGTRYFLSRQRCLGPKDCAARTSQLHRHERVFQRDIEAPLISKRHWRVSRDSHGCWKRWQVPLPLIDERLCFAAKRHPDGEVYAVARANRTSDNPPTANASFLRFIIGFLRLVFSVPAVPRLPISQPALPGRDASGGRIAIFWE